METRRSHFIVYSKKRWFLDYIFRTKATKVSYARDKYILYFKKGISASRLQNYCGGMPVKIQPVRSKISKREKILKEKNENSSTIMDTMDSCVNDTRGCEVPMLCVETKENIYCFEPLHVVNLEEKNAVDSKDNTKDSYVNDTMDSCCGVPSMYIGTMSIAEPNDNAVDYTGPCADTKPYMEDNSLIEDNSTIMHTTDTKDSSVNDTMDSCCEVPMLSEDTMVNNSCGVLDEGNKENVEEKPIVKNL